MKIRINSNTRPCILFLAGISSILIRTAAYPTFILFVIFLNTSCSTVTISNIDPNVFLTNHESQQISKNEAVETIEFIINDINKAPFKATVTSTGFQKGFSDFQYMDHARFRWDDVTKVELEKTASAEHNTYYIVHIHFPVVDNGRMRYAKYKLCFFQEKVGSRPVTESISSIQYMSRFLCALKALTPPQAWE